jgi:hypothetical protein
VLNGIERFRAIVNESFLDRGTVRRGAREVVFWSSSSSLTNWKICCCIFFVWKRRHRRSGRRIKDRDGKSRERSEDERWLTGKAGKEILLPFPAEAMKIRAVSSRVNKPENNDPRLLEEGEIEQVGRLI